VRRPQGNIRTGAVIACALVCAPALARAQDGTGGQAASFLKVPVGARLMASPDAVAGMRPDASLVYSNPAFLAGLDHPGLFVTSGRWLDDVSFNAAGVAMPIGRHGTVLGLGASLLYSGGLSGYDDAMNVVGEESFQDAAFDAVVSHRVGSTGLSLAAGATYIREHVVPEDGSGRAFHFGASYARGPYLLHAAARDLAGAMSFPSGSWAVEAEWLAGAARAFDTRAGLFFAGLQAASSAAYGTRLRFGVDYAVSRAFTLRGAWGEDVDAAQTSSRVSGGFGMRYGALSLEYAFTPQAYFSAAHTFSLGFDFGAAPTAERPGAVVPAGDFAPELPASVATRRVRGDETAKPTLFWLVGGSHGTRESARSEAHALELVRIPASVETEGPRFRVVIGRFPSFEAADQARARYRARGHVFQIIAR
jgi:hypothetical protein